MCGIVGFTGKKNFSTLSRLLQLIEHRGRDGKTLFFSQGVHLGMNRLAIIDLSRHLYPMKYMQYTLVFNGEIYNYQELKQRLIKKGVSFFTTSDAEVILPLFALYGWKSFAMLEGMFAIAIYDDVKNRMILSRDKFGEKPLYYMKTVSGIAFASELKVLLSFPKAPAQFDKVSLPQYLTHGFVFAPDTLIRSVHKIPPSNYLIYQMSTRTTNIKKYWEPIRHILPFLNNKEKCPEDQLDALLRRSVHLRLVADVPVGCFLSGGIDSSLITLFASQEKQNLRTYSVSFPGYASYDESAFASFVARQLKTKHSVVHCTPQHVQVLLDHIGAFVDEPIIDPAVLPTLLMAQEARKNVKVVLTGEGADELFGGYTRYAKQFFAETIRNHIPLASCIFALPGHRMRLLSKTLAERYSAQNVWTNEEIGRLLKYKFAPPFQHPYLRKYSIVNPLLSMQLTDYRGYMAEQLLMKIDKSTMAKNLEARAPYLDSNLISFALGLPISEKIRLTNGKYILKKVAERYFPKSFVFRNKHGFDVPLDDWFRKDLKSYVYQSLDSLSAYGELFNIDYYREIIFDHMEGRSNNANRIWSMIVLGNWLSHYKVIL